MTDNINQPAHYTAGGIETIDVIEGVLGKYDHRDQVEKYNQRAHLKGNFQQDLEKARWYLNRTIENCEKGLLESGTGTPIKGQPASRLATDMDTDAVYKDDDGDFWAYNQAEEKWHYYRMNGNEVIGKSPGGFTQEDMAAFSRDFFTSVEYKLPILLAVARYEEREKEEAGKKFDTDTVHKDNDGDYWVFNDSTQVWNWYTLSGDLGTVLSYGGFFTVEDLERNFETHFIEPVEDEQSARKVREAVEEYDNPSTEIVLGVTDPASMPVGTTAYRDGVETSYTATKEGHGWKFSNFDFFRIADEQVAFWFENEEGWSLEPPSDVYRDSDGDYWANMGDGWRWHYINGGQLEYTSIRKQELEDIMEVHSLQKLNDREALRVRRIIREGEK